MEEAKSSIRKKKIPSLVVIFDRKKVASKTKAASVEIRVSYNRKSRYFATGISCKIGQFINGNFRGENAIANNKLLREYTDKLWSQIYELENSGDVDLNRLSLFDELKSDEYDFYDWCEASIKRRNIRESSKQSYLNYIKTINKSGIIKSILDLEDRSKIAKLDTWLTKNGHKSNVQYHGALKVVISDALEIGIIKESPYKYFKVRKNKELTIKYLTEDELSKIEQYQPKSESESYTRDFFLISAYTGLSLSDIYKINKKDIRTKNGHKILIDRREKTNVPYSVMLLPKTISVMERMNYVFDRFHRLKLYRIIRTIGQKVLGRNLTMHMGRHTFATMAIGRGIPLEIISKMLAHSDIMTTQIYAKVEQKQVDDAYLLME